MSATIAFDGSILAAGPVTGVAGSFLATLHGYARLTEHRCVLLTAGSRPTAVEIPGVENLPCLGDGRMRRLRTLREGCRASAADLLHSPVTAIPARNPCPTIATVHDLPWLHPELRGEPGSRLLRRLAVHLAARTAAAVIVPSDATRGDLLGFARIDPSRVHRIHHGVAGPEDPAPAEDLTGPFLVLGGDRTRKNVPRIRSAHAAARRRDPSLPDLRIVGPGHGYLPEAEKWRVLRRSRALLQVSLLEGFGLPVVEAFAHGVPVLCSDSTSLPEVAGDAALLVDPRDEAAIAAGLLRLHRDEGLRSELRRRGLRRAAGLTPERSAGHWLELHRSLLARPV